MAWMEVHHRTILGPHNFDCIAGKIWKLLHIWTCCNQHQLLSHSTLVPTGTTEERVLRDSGTRRATSAAGHTLRLDSRIGVAVAPGAQQRETTHPKFA